MDIKAELEALREIWSTNVRECRDQGLEDRASAIAICANDLNTILARLPPDAVVARDVGDARIADAPPGYVYGEQLAWSQGWNAHRRAMLAAEENSDDRG